MAASRQDRYGGEVRTLSASVRSEWAVDRDRVLYSDAFRRLDGVTQVAASHEGRSFHNRLTHSVKVGQVARRLSERLKSDLDIEPLERLGGLEPETSEAAAFSHDLGTPPFGHTGEAILDQLVRDAGDPDGFEGNAQTFRILTRLEAHKTSHPCGLSLTRATLRAVLKYPWLRDLEADRDEPQHKKWGAYRCDRAAFDFAMDQPVAKAGRTGPTRLRSLEAEVMNWADDVTYAVHDLEDFYRAGLIPLDRLRRDESFAKEMVAELIDRYDLEPLRAERVWAGLVEQFPAQPFDGSLELRNGLYETRSSCITNLLDGFRISIGNNGPLIELDEDTAMQAELLKKLTRSFVIDGPDLAPQRKGQEYVIRNLFIAHLNAAEEPNSPLLKQYRIRGWTVDEPSRLAADIVSSLSEAEALALHARLYGYQMGSVWEPVVGI